MMKPTSTAALVLGLAAAGVHAAELGEATVRSHAGEQLVADVELVDLTAQDLADLQVRLASRNVFQGANVSMSPALAGMNVTVTKRDSRRVLHLTTGAPIQSEVLHLYFELTSGGRQSVRGVSLWLPAAPPAPPAPPAPVPVAQPTRIVAAPVVPASEPVARSRPAGISVQLAVPGKQATPAESELMGAVERAFAARPAGKAHVRPVPAVLAEEPAAPVVKIAEKPVPVLAKVAEKPAPKAAKAAAKPEPTVAKAADKPASIIPPLPAIAKPTETVPAKPEADKAMLKKLAELEAKLKTLQAAVAKKAATPPPAPVPPKAPANKVAVAPAPADRPAAAAPAHVPPKAPDSKVAVAPAPAARPVAATPASHVEQSAAVVTATEPPGRTAAGKITDAREDKPSHDEESGATHEADKPVADPAPKPEPKKAAPPPEEPVKEKKMSRPKVLTIIAAGTAGLVLVIGVVVHLVRRRKAKQASAQIKVWQSWRKKAIAEAATAEEEAPAEAGAA